MLNASASGGGALDPNNRGAFSSPFTAAPGQGAGNAFPPHGNMAGMQHSNSLNALQGRFPGMGAPTAAAGQQQQQQQAAAQGRFAAPGGLQQLGQQGMQGAMRGQVSGQSGQPFSMNGLAGNAAAAAAAMNSMGNRGGLGGNMGMAPGLAGAGGIGRTVSQGGPGMERSGSGANLGAMGNVASVSSSGQLGQRSLSGGVNMAGLNGRPGGLAGMGPLGGGVGNGVNIAAGSPVRTAASMGNLGGLQPGVGGGAGSFNNSSGDILAMISKGMGPSMSMLGGAGNSSAFGSSPPGMHMQGSGEGDQPAFDMSDFPSLGGRQPGGGMPGLGGLGANGDMSLGMDPYGAIAMQKAGQQHPEFSIQNEDFPALPGAPGGGPFKGGEEGREGDGMGGFAGQHFNGPRGLGSGFLQAPGGGMMSGGQGAAQGQLGQGGGSSDHPHMGGGGNGAFSSNSDSFMQNHAMSGGAMSGAYQQQGMSQQGQGGAMQGGLGGSQGPSAGGGRQGYEQLMSQQQFHQQQQMQRPPGMMPHAAAGPGGQAAAGGKGGAASGKAAPAMGSPDRFGLLGLLSVIRMSDPDLTTLALGTDLTTLGLNLNSPESLYKTFSSPWADGPSRAEPEFTLPSCYLQQAPRLQPGYFSKFQLDTLFYIFYSMPGDEAQVYAGDELANRGWMFHKEHKVWITRAPGTESLVKTDRYERGSFIIFDANTWERVRKDNLELHYNEIQH
mmetsp:Transcript_65508/g.207068  ORF Transcript_65508/g.207068 Transcript_65508/m.207068 type:complete len:721 (-) Transcript_65508:104-2266(-)